MVLYLIDSHYRGMLLAEKYQADSERVFRHFLSKPESGSSQFAQAFQAKKTLP